MGFRNQALSSKCFVKNINWVNKKYKEPVNVLTSVRYSTKPASSILIPGENTALVKFDKPQFAITPGQGAVFYKNDEVIAGGWIE